VIIDQRSKYKNETTPVPMHHERRFGFKEVFVEVLSEKKAKGGDT
jgi:hypothetical protein